MTKNSKCKTNRKCKTNCPSERELNNLRMQAAKAKMKLTDDLLTRLGFVRHTMGAGAWQYNVVRDGQQHSITLRPLSSQWGRNKSYIWAYGMSIDGGEERYAKSELDLIVGVQQLGETLGRLAAGVALGKRLAALAMEGF